MVAHRAIFHITRQQRSRLICKQCVKVIISRSAPAVTGCEGSRLMSAALPRSTAASHSAKALKSASSRVGVNPSFTLANPNSTAQQAVGPTRPISTNIYIQRQNSHLNSCDGGRFAIRESTHAYGCSRAQIGQIFLPLCCQENPSRNGDLCRQASVLHKRECVELLTGKDSPGTAAWRRLRPALLSPSHTHAMPPLSCALHARVTEHFSQQGSLHHCNNSFTAGLHLPVVVLIVILMPMCY